jgi:antitoxin PrlF
MVRSGVVSTKGQVTIPRDIRRRLGLKVGDRVEFVVEGDRTTIRPSRGTPNPFEKYRGALKTFPGGKKEINAWMAGIRDEEA